ncbi:MAG: hypothetical protein WAV28_18765 [Sedimentisphaerales bacterium]
MASGLPDYLKVVRPRYGGAKYVAWQKQAQANQDTTMGEVEGKGVIYGGSILCVYTSTQKNSLPKIIIDGVELVSASFYSMIYYGIIAKKAAPFYLMKYNDADFIYGAGILPGITFESSVVVKYGERNGATPTLVGWIVYALL